MKSNIPMDKHSPLHNQHCFSGGKHVLRIEINSTPCWAHGQRWFCKGKRFALSAFTKTTSQRLWKKMNYLQIAGSEDILADSEIIKREITRAGMNNWLCKGGELAGRRDRSIEELLLWTRTDVFKLLRKTLKSSVQGTLWNSSQRAGARFSQDVATLGFNSMKYKGFN